MDMKAAGIIAEYNPFHPGHLYHIEQTRKLLQPDVLVVIVSGYFSSRGLPSLLSPQDKARLALEAGADLVLELPAVCTMQSADRFARYALESLKAAGVSEICFGSECANLAALESMSSRLDAIEKDPSGSMARNTAKALEHLRPNDILGIQYLYWCRPLGVKAFCIERNQDCISATQSRKDYFNGIRHENDELYDPSQRWENYYPYLRMALLMTDAKRLSDFLLVEEGIEHRLKKAAAKADTWDEFLQAAISKGYTRARIQRTCMMILLQADKRKMKENGHFFALKVLGFNNAGRRWLAGLDPEIPVWSRLSDLPPFWRHEDLQARTLWSLIAKTSLPVWKIVRMEKPESAQPAESDENEGNNLCAHDNAQAELQKAKERRQS